MSIATSHKDHLTPDPETIHTPENHRAQLVTELATRSALDTDPRVFAGDYNEYYDQFETTQATITGRQLRALDARLTNPATKTGEQAIDTMPPAKVAAEWYLKLGPLNHLRGAEGKLAIAASQLWTGRDRSDIQAFNPLRAMTVEIGRALQQTEAARKDPDAPLPIMDTVHAAWHNPMKLKDINLASDALLDATRCLDGNNTKAREAQLFARQSYMINTHILREAATNIQAGAEPTESQKRAISDALKGKYEASFEMLRLQMPDNDTYLEQSSKMLEKQTRETRRYMHWMSNGDLAEHYFANLTRYAATVWTEDETAIVRATTRRQDEPHDNFLQAEGKTYGFDIDVQTRDTHIPIQLKTGHQENTQGRYADEILVIDTILDPVGESKYTSSNENVRNREDMETGLRELQVLLHEVNSGAFASTKLRVIQKHAERMRTALSQH